jgi:hypothetical protein
LSLAASKSECYAWLESYLKVVNEIVEDREEVKKSTGSVERVGVWDDGTARRFLSGDSPTQ